MNEKFSSIQMTKICSTSIIYSLNDVIEESFRIKHKMRKLAPNEWFIYDLVSKFGQTFFFTVSFQKILRSEWWSWGRARQVLD